MYAGVSLGETLQDDSLVPPAHWSVGKQTLVSPATTSKIRSNEPSGGGIGRVPLRGQLHDGCEVRGDSFGMWFQGVTKGVRR
jgi:hypothetical protein